MGGGRRGGKRLKAKMKKSIKNSYIDRHILSVSVSLKTQNRNPYYISKESGRFKNKIPKQSNLRQKRILNLNIPLCFFCIGCLLIGMGPTLRCGLCAQ